MEKLEFFEFQVPTRILFEENAVAENLGRVIELIEADKALLVTDAGVAQFHVPHGLACGMFLPDIMEFNLDTAPEKYALIAAAMGLNMSGLSPEQAAQQAIEAVRKLYSEIGLPQNLAEFGAKSDDIPDLAQIAICDGCVLMNPRPCEPEDFEKLFAIFV